MSVVLWSQPELAPTGSSWIELEPVGAGGVFIFISSATELGLARACSSSKELERAEPAASKMNQKLIQKRLSPGPLRRASPSWLEPARLARAEFQNDYSI